MEQGGSMTGCEKCSRPLFSNERDICARCVFIAANRVEWLSKLMLAPQRMDVGVMLRRGDALKYAEERRARIDAGTASRADEQQDWPIEACIAGAEMEENFIHGSSTLIRPKGIVNA
jgi:ribosomal protein L37E